MDLPAFSLYEFSNGERKDSSSLNFNSQTTLFDTSRTLIYFMMFISVHSGIGNALLQANTTRLTLGRSVLNTFLAGVQAFCCIRRRQIRLRRLTYVNCRTGRYGI
ncbi:hypothetical protein PRIPAC_95020 [Pristionchus pacificus]|uniref:Uncharacterized protein n=1 Tax=Pristionchus pacificus TaxID=54126 RepID=A0A2A6CDA0_PRIPA|nr:hypothetical protein PRIPAC_95020 [Pristionchus pacificus]|eukprot:PDM76078.1 hypothetical protein PRIPAC_39682 [Pristionchus pacificus]